MAFEERKDLSRQEGRHRGQTLNWHSVWGRYFGFAGGCDGREERFGEDCRERLGEVGRESEDGSRIWRDVRVGWGEGGDVVEGEEVVSWVVIMRWTCGWFSILCRHEGSERGGERGIEVRRYGHERVVEEE
jgi:hypothetical protein